MSFKLAFVASLVFLAVTCVRAGIPAPQAPGGPRSQCGIWRSALQANGMPATANRLTASHTSALKQTMIKRSTLEARRIPGHIPTLEIAGSSGNPGACGVAYSGIDNVVCLWDGHGGPAPARGLTPGWVTGSSTNNCFRQIWVKANGRQVTGVLADSCDIVKDQHLSIDDGCSAIYISDNMMAQLGTPGAGAIEVDFWDFVDAAELAW